MSETTRFNKWEVVEALLEALFSVTQESPSAQESAETVHGICEFVGLTLSEMVQSGASPELYLTATDLIGRVMVRRMAEIDAKTGQKGEA